MCGRFALGGDRDDIFNDVVRNGMLPDDADDEDWVDREDFYPRYNIAPRSRAPVIRRRRGGNDDEDVNMANADEQVANEGADDAQLDETEETSQTDEIDGDNVASSSSRGPMVQTAHNKPTHLDVPRVKSREDASKRVKYTPVPQNKLNMMQTMRWGLLHHQYTTDSPAHTTNTINARSETLLESERGIWGSIKATNRCIVVCDGYV